MRHEMKFLLFAAAILIFGGCKPPDDRPRVEIILPAGFSGHVWIVEDAEGQVITLSNGEYKFTVAANGVLRVKSLAVLRADHNLSSHFDNGDALPPGERSRDEQTALRRRFSRGGSDLQAVVFFVGTAKELRDQKFDPWYPPDVETVDHCCY